MMTTTSTFEFPTKYGKLRTDLKLANTTPHKIVIENGLGKRQEFPPLIEGGFRLIPPQQTNKFKINDVDVVEPPDFSESKLNGKHVEFLKSVDCDVIIVSLPLGQYLKENQNVLRHLGAIGPDTGATAKRDKNGNIEAATKWIFYRYGEKLSKLAEYQDFK